MLKPTATACLRGVTNDLSAETVETITMTRSFFSLSVYDALLHEHVHHDDNHTPLRKLAIFASVIGIAAVISAFSWDETRRGPWHTRLGFGVGMLDPRRIFTEMNRRDVHGASRTSNDTLLPGGVRACAGSFD